MKNFVLYEKLSKKEKRRLNLQRRKNWSTYGVAFPATRVVPNKKRQLEKKLCRELIRVDLD